MISLSWLNITVKDFAKEIIRELCPDTLRNPDLIRKFKEFNETHNIIDREDGEIGWDFLLPPLPIGLAKQYEEWVKISQKEYRRLLEIEEKWLALKPSVSISSVWVGDVVIPPCTITSTSPNDFYTQLPAPGINLTDLSKALDRAMDKTFAKMARAVMQENLAGDNGNQG